MFDDVFEWQDLEGHIVEVTLQGTQSLTIETYRYCYVLYFQEGEFAKFRDFLVDHPPIYDSDNETYQWEKHVLDLRSTAKENITVCLERYYDNDMIIFAVTDKTKHRSYRMEFHFGHCFEFVDMLLNLTPLQADKE